ncbi:alpha/beta fold hydrolase [Streptomyces sp. NBC_01471]|uniref:alpha/beta hydrolase n=1 Tax=Streptomyces sp. NBC_01471 TaxID=2903879 RepID=UPI00324C0919
METPEGRPNSSRPQTRAAAPLQMKTGIAYGSHKRQSLDAYWAVSTAPKPVLVIIHGGYWYQDSDWSNWTDDFAAEGFQVFAIKYRMNFEAAWPAQRDDVASSIAWIRAHAAEYDADPDNVSVIGASAGGQMATDAATHGTNALKLRGVVALSPVASPYRAWGDGNTSTNAKDRKLRDNAAILAGCYPDSGDNTTDLRNSGCWDTWKSMVSKNWVNRGDAPMLLMHSEDDFVPAIHSTDLETTAEAKGVPDADVETQIVPDSSAHGGALLSEPGVYDSVVTWLKARTA